jgi:competence protein ComFB
MEMKNYMETVVKEALKQVLANIPGVCRCDRCQMDMMALALNRLTPSYTVTHTGAIFTKLRMWDPDNQVKILAEVTKAVMQVAERPHHNEGLNT